MAEIEDPAARITTPVTNDNLAIADTIDSDRSSDEGYLVELVAPRARTLDEDTTQSKLKKEKKFKLFLTADNPLPDPSRLPYRRRPSSSISSESESDEEADICTEENWRDFYSYHQKNYYGPSKSKRAPSKWFDQTSKSDSKPFDLTLLTGDRDDMDRVNLTIRSPYLQEQLWNVIAIEHYHGVSISESTTILGSPFPPLYHHLEEMKINVSSDPNATDLDKKHMDALYYFTKFGWPGSIYGDVKNLLSRGLIVYDKLWAVFKPGDLVVTRDPIGIFTLAEVTSVKYEEHPSPGRTQYRWWVELVTISQKNGQFRKFSVRNRLEKFAGARKIIELDFYPLKYHDRADELMEEALVRGRKWKNFIEGQTKVMNYEGEALPIILAETAFPPRSYGSDIGDDTEINSSKRACTVIVDPHGSSKAVEAAGIDEKQRMWHHSFHDGGVLLKAIKMDFTDKDFMICPATITIFNLDDHDWYSVCVSGLKEKVWTPKSFDRLVLDQDRKDTLIRLASTNSKLVQAYKSKDIIEGKGKGVVLLLHGPPGVGKTLTAEVLSEYTKRPLLKVNLGRIASHKKWEQSLELIFTNAEEWKAILLIDEAEIVLEKRTFERMTQNAWISVFLRKLEYYQGILILTTNLIDCIDEAFESRISYPIHFQELSRDDRHQIWSGFINAMKIAPAYKTTLMNEVDRWSEAEINGRQIRNVILMAENLANSETPGGEGRGDWRGGGRQEGKRLTPHHVDELLGVTLEFCEFNRGNARRLKRVNLTGPSY